AEIEIQNAGAADFAATVEFFGQDGKPAEFELRLLGRDSTPERSSRFQFPVPAGTLQTLRGGSGDYAAKSGWARVTAGAFGKVSVTYALTPIADGGTGGF